MKSLNDSYIPPFDVIRKSLKDKYGIIYRHIKNIV